MNSSNPVITFRAQTRTRAGRLAVYDALADLSTHLTWGGEETGDKKFRLLTLDQPGGTAVTGTRFSSTGVIPMGTFHDETTVTEATPGVRFAFHTQSVLERRHRRPIWRGAFKHRYTIDDAGGTTVISYTCEVYPENYVAWWMTRPVRRMTRYNVERTMRVCLGRLAALAEEPKQTVPQARHAAPAS